MHTIEPYYGWLKFYENESDPNSPFQDVVHNEFWYDRQIHEYLAHPQWDSIGAEGLLVKILMADYEQRYAIIEIFGVWNDILENDFRLLLENCLEPLMSAGIARFVLIVENVLNIYLDADDYYQQVTEELEDGWICLFRAREHVRREIEDHDMGQYFFWSEPLDELHWRKLKPIQLYQLVQSKMLRLIE